MKHIGQYIHIPFCAKKCDYCDFISFEQKNSIITRYIECLKQELQEVGESINLYAQSGKSDYVTVDTIYIGGGTPSFIDSKYIEEIMNVIKNNFTLHKDAEITIEINPGTANKEKLETYKKLGINRCSIGMQVTSDKLLNVIGRIHKTEDFLKTYELARNSRFNNINIDFMIGIPEQNISDIDEILRIVNNLNPEHVSVYSLIIEDGTRLKSKIDNKVLRLPDDSLERKMYWKVKRGLENLGYIHYEISNFSKKGYESRHNLDCWEQKEYIGFGCAAHSYTDNVRYSNTDNLDEYIENYMNNKQEDNIIFHEKQDVNTKMNEYMILGLRKIQGINKAVFYKKFEKDIEEVYESKINKLIDKNLLEWNDSNIQLTDKGIDFANLVWQEFV